MPARMTLARAHTEGFDLVRLHTDRFADAVLDLSADDLALSVPAMEWTVGEVVAHMQSVYERYTVDLGRAPSVEALAAQNQQDVDRIGVDAEAAVASMRQQLATLEPIVAHIEPDRLFPFHAGGSTTMAGGWGNLLGELLAHGDDIARATHWDFTMPGQDMELAWCYTLPILGPWMAPTPFDDASWDLSFDFGTVNVRFVDGTMTHGVDDDLPRLTPHHDVLVEDAADYMLVFPYRRRAATDDATALLVDRFVTL